jgi:hypothetical protein
VAAVPAPSSWTPVPLCSSALILVRRAELPAPVPRLGESSAAFELAIWRRWWNWSTEAMKSVNRFCAE